MEEIPIGPNRCNSCGGEYGEHDEQCRYMAPKQSVDRHHTIKIIPQRDGNILVEIRSVDNDGKEWSSDCLGPSEFVGKHIRTYLHHALKP